MPDVLGEHLRPVRLMARVIGAVMLRETRTRFGRSRLGYLWALIEPMVHVISLMTVFSLLGRRSPVDGDLAVFIVSGVVPFLIFTHLVKRVTSAVDGNRALLAYPQVTTVDLIVARAALEALTLVTVFALVCLGLLLSGRDLVIRDLAAIALALAALVLMVSGIGMVSAALNSVSDVFGRFYAVTTRPLYFISGIFFNIDTVPRPFRDWFLYNPLLHVVEWVRVGFFGDRVGAHLDVSYVLLWVLGSLVAGFACERVLRARMLEA